jgi:uncharacterized protein (DUF1810 family)
MIPSAPLDLERFVAAQARDYAQALAELKAGEKQTHWIWYVLPQLRGLGHSELSQTYGIASLAEARAYLAHPLLGPRLKACIEALLGHQERSAAAMLGEMDALKLRSCLTLFMAAAPAERLFADALDRFFDGQPDPRTLQRLQAQPG